MLFKNILEAQEKHIPQIKKGTKWNSEAPEWFNTRVKEAIQGKKGIPQKMEGVPKRGKL